MYVKDGPVVQFCVTGGEGGEGDDRVRSTLEFRLRCGLQK